MKKKLFALLAFVMAAMTASAKDVPTYSLTKADDAEAHGTITFKVGENAVTSAKEGDVVTVTITPDKGYVVNQVKGQWSAAEAKAPQRRSIDLLNNFTLTPVSGKENTWSFTMERANIEISVTYMMESYVVFTPWQFEKTFGDEDFTITPEVIGDGTLMYSSEDESIAVVDDVTGQVTIKGVGYVKIYARLSATLNYTSASDWYELTVNAKPIEYEGGDVTEDEDGYTVNMTEDTGNPNPDPLPDDADLSNLTYQRDLTAPGNEPGGDGSGDIEIDDQPANLFTICLPFVPKTDATAKYYTLSSVIGETISFDEVAEPVSHTPYMVAVFGDVNFTEDCSNLDVSSMTINSTTVDGYTFTGTFTGLKNADALGKYILQRNSQWGKVTSGSVFIPPFRAFVEAPATSTPLLNGVIGDGSATGIKNIRTTDLDGKEHWYDLSGRRMATPAKGINILNGKKVVTK